MASFWGTFVGCGRKKIAISGFEMQFIELCDVTWTKSLLQTRQNRRMSQVFHLTLCISTELLANVSWNLEWCSSKNIWFNTPPTEVTAYAYYLLLFSSGDYINPHYVALHIPPFSHLATLKLYNNFLMVFSSWKCCAKILELYSFEIFV